MARPERNNVDYFPFLCKEGTAMKVIERKYGNDGFAVWIKILRELAVTNYHYLNLSDEDYCICLESICNVDVTKLHDIINDLCKLKEFDRELWEGHKVIYNQKFIDSVQDAYARRNNKCVTRDDIFSLIKGELISKNEIKPVEVIKKQPIKVQTIIHEPFKIKGNLDDFFDSLEKGNEINEVARVTNIPIEFLKSKLQSFRKTADLNYPSYIKFVTHFKNWAVKIYNSDKEKIATSPRGRRLD